MAKGMQDLTSPTRDGTCALCSGNTVLTTGPSWKSQECLTQSPGKFSGSVLVNWAVLSPSVLSDSCDPIDCNLLGPSVHGILQARVLEWVAVSFSRGSSQPRSPALQSDSLPTELRFSSAAQSCPTLCGPVGCSTPGFPVHPNSRSLLRLMSHLMRTP